MDIHPNGLERGDSTADVRINYEKASERSSVRAKIDTCESIRWLIHLHHSSDFLI